MIHLSDELQICVLLVRFIAAEGSIQNEIIGSGTQLNRVRKYTN